MIGPGIVERAFELARDGSCATLDEIRRRLKREQFTQIDAHLAGFSIRRQLKQLLVSGPQPAQTPPATETSGVAGERSGPR